LIDIRNIIHIFLFYLNAIVLIQLIIIIIIKRKKLVLDVFYNGKIYYKNEKKLNLDEIQNQIKNYKKLKILFDNRGDFVKRKTPKISLIITIYNQEYFIKYAYSSFLKQELKDIEIIFVDDASSDDSSKIIKNLMKKDKRIIYIKNKFNKNAFYSRNLGVLFSNGEYILIIDPDDLLLNNILIKCYETSEYFNLDILQYFAMRGSYGKNMIWFNNKYRSGILNSENVKDVFFYSISRTLWDKLIKRDTFIKGINFMKKKFQHEIYFVHSDDTIFWGIINSGNSYGFLEQIGYFYNHDNPASIVHHYFDSNFMNLIFHSLFATMNYYFFQTKNNEVEKNLVAYKFFNNKVYNPYLNLTDELTEGFNYIIEVLNKYIKCFIFNETQLLKLVNFKKLIIKRKYIVNQYYFDLK